MRSDAAIAIRPIGLDDLSEVRHVHSLAYRALTGPSLAEDQVDAIIEFIRSRDYSDYLLGHGCIGAWIDNYLCGTAGWGPGSTIGAGAKLAAICVDPLFTRLTIGRRLVEATELRARRAGFGVITARTTVNAVPFFEQLGYAMSSRGAWLTPAGVSVPVVHMRKSAERDIQKAPVAGIVANVAEHRELATRLH